jgi:hypothetical protein
LWLALIVVESCSSVFSNSCFISLWLVSITVESCSSVFSNSCFISLCLVSIVVESCSSFSSKSKIILSNSVLVALSYSKFWIKRLELLICVYNLSLISFIFSDKSISAFRYSSK